MQYRVVVTQEALEDVSNLADYMIDTFKNQQAAENFLDAYDRQVGGLSTFPIGYRGISMEYRGYEIRLKPFDTYNLFFVVDEEMGQIVILRLLKNLQDWKQILGMETKYHFEL